MDNYDFNYVKRIGSDFLENDVDFLENVDSMVEWAEPFKTIVRLPSGTKGKFGRNLVAQCFTDTGLTVSREKRNLIVVNGLRVAIKTAFEGQNGTWIFEQIREPHDYDFLCWIGITPNDVKFFVFSSKEVKSMMNDKILTYRDGRDDWWCHINVDVMPTRYLGDGKIETAIEIFSKCSTGDYISHWGQTKVKEQ